MLPQLTLPLAQGSLTLPLSVASATALQAQLDQLREAFRASASSPSGPSSPKQPQANLEFQQREPLFLEIFCNPNIWPTPFAAKLLITLKSPLIRLSVEVELPQLQEALAEFLTTHA